MYFMLSNTKKEETTMKEMSEHEIRYKLQQQQTEKLQNLKERVMKFSDITTLEDAKLLASDSFRVSSEFTEFSISNAKCTIINKDKLFRISLNTPEEFISYDFE